VGGLLEKVIRPTGVTEYRHMIPAGSATAIYTRRSNSTNSTYYVTSDHLGSGDLVLDSAGAVLARESFTPFGERRGSNWQGLPSAADKTVFGNVTRRGFTGHEMLDAVGLVHMNGRVYDPKLARFLSVDPIIPTISLSQALNPYSYVMNNPLTLIDPSGYSWLSKQWKSVKKAVKGAFKSLGRWLKDSAAEILAAAFAMMFPGGWLKLIVGTVISTALNGGLTVGYSWGFGGGRNRSGFGAAGAGPPGVGTPGINPTAQVPGLMSLQGGEGELSKWLSDAVWNYLFGSGILRHRGRSTAQTREDTVAAAAAWMRSQGLIVFTPAYLDIWRVEIRENVYGKCGGTDPTCGGLGRVVGGWTEGKGGAVTIFRAGVVPVEPQIDLADPVARRPRLIPVAYLSPIERAILTIGHENYHYLHGEPPPNRDDEFFANDMGWDAVLAYRAWLQQRYGQ
jgi:RHS repeat-associated protein